MKLSFFAIILIISFASVAVFGFWLMTHDQMMGHGSCVANTVQGSMCAQVSPFAFAGFHISAFNSFISVIMQNLATFALIIIALIAMIAMAFLGIMGAPPSAKPYRLPNYGNKPEFIHKIRFATWYSLHENSPSFALAR